MTVQAAALNGQPEGRLFYGKPLIYRDKAHLYFWDGEPVPGVTTILGHLAKPGLIQWAADEAVNHIYEGWNETYSQLPSGDEFEALCDAARKAHTVKKDAGADVGTHTHAYAQDCFRAKYLLSMPARADLEAKFKETRAPLDLIPKLINGVIAGCKGFQDFFSKHTIQTIEVERLVMYRTPEVPGQPRAPGCYAGRTDFFGRIDGKLGVLDIKTSNTVIDRKTGDLYREMQLQLTGYEVALSTELMLAEPLMRWILHLDKNTGAHKLYEKPTSTPAILAWLALVRFDQMMRVMGKAA